MNAQWDKHDVFVSLVLSTQQDDTSDFVMAARLHIAGCAECQQRLPSDMELLRAVLWSEQQSL